MARRNKKSLLETAQEVVEQVADSAQDLAGQVTETLAPTLEGVVETVKEKAEDALASSEELLHAGVEEGKKGGKFKKFLLVTVLAAVGGVIFAKVRSKKAQDANWQTSYTPTPTTTAAQPAAPKPAAPAEPAAPAAPAEPAAEVEDEAPEVVEATPEDSDEDAVKD
jgi:hypothetical protein